LEKKMKKKITMMFASGILVLGLLAGTISTVFAYGGGNGNSGKGVGGSCYGNLCLNNSANADSTALSDSETAGLMFMVEEEKLARDVYQYLASRYSLAAFSNIANSEQSHMDALLSIIENHGLTSPLSSESGVFSNSNLQALYIELTAKGSQSLADALLVGGTIEEIDIRDLQSYIVATTNTSLAQVYTNLLNGSNNHLKAFVNEYESQTGAAYVPQYLDSVTFQTAISSGTTQGGQGRGNARHGR
jgi:hypothetical protein